MKHKRFLIECSKNYAAKIFRCPECIEDFDFMLHWHRDYEFIYVEKGPLKIQKLDGEIILNDGEVYFINSEEIHSYADITSDLKFVVINIPVKALQPYFENLTDCLTFDISDPTIKKKIAGILHCLNECEDLEGKVETLKIKAVINDACYYLMKHCQAPDIEFMHGSDSNDFECAKSAIRYMKVNFRKNIPLDEIARYVGMTPAHFSKYFKDKTEVTFSKYLSQLRLEHALVDIQNNNVSVKEAALNNGFPNVNSFILTCKTEYGRTPLEMKMYRKT
ncbi:MAG: AraC family transcriptional regulator [Ruminococcus sp.]|nr:AraC family transcriptional regulator [Ruminococcus sp.]